MKYPIGYTYINRNKKICTVIDFLTTTNLDGVIVKERYVTMHKFMGQEIIDYDVVETSISMGKEVIR